MAAPAFVSSFHGVSLSRTSFHNVLSQRRQRPHVASKRRAVFVATLPSKNASQTTRRPPSHREIGIIAKTRTKEQMKESTEATSGIGLFGMKANAYWESIGAAPLIFAGFGVTALVIKMFKVKSGQMRSGASGINKAVTHKSVITSEEEEAELHVFKCGGCGYEMYPARGREFKFFPDSFKCPLCGTPKSEFWDLNDPNDPRNQEEEEEEEEVAEEDADDLETESLSVEGNGSSSTANDQVPDSGGTGTTAKDRGDSEPST